MAFGTFFKKIVEGVKNIARKAVPIVQKTLSAIDKYSKPVANVVDMIPGASGFANGIRQAGRYAATGNQFIDKLKGGGLNMVPKLVGQNGTGQRAITADNFAKPNYV